MSKQYPKINWVHLEIMDYSDEAEADLVLWDNRIAMEKLLASYREYLAAGRPSQMNKRIEWRYLADNLDKAEEALANGDIQHVALRFFWIGQIVAKLSLPTWEEWSHLIEKAMNASKSNRARMSGIAGIRETASDMKEEARQIAKELWAADTEKELFIGEVADLVINELHAKLDKETAKKIPKTNATMRKWIRPVAPGYATDPGRPVKDKT